MKIAIVGGCFTNQHNILFDRLYHQTLKRNLEANDWIVEIKTIRYETISKCLQKIIELQNNFPFDLLLFHLRAEPIMRMSKLYYKYIDDKGILMHALNFPLLNVLYSEKFDLLLQSPVTFQADDNIRESNIHHLLRELNYLAGSFIGNKKYAIGMVEKTILQINKFCLDIAADFLLLGPVSRPFSKFENGLSEKINKVFGSMASKKSISYLNLLKTVSKDNKPMFFEMVFMLASLGMMK